MEATEAEIIGITIASLEYLRSMDDRASIGELIAAVMEAYGLPDAWKRELWAGMSDELKEWTLG